MLERASSGCSEQPPPLRTGKALVQGSELSKSTLNTTPRSLSQTSNLRHTNHRWFANISDT